MQDDKLAADEARRASQHGAIKAEVEGDVNAEIAARADRPTTRPEAERMEQVAGEFRGKAIDEVVETEREVERGRGAARISQLVDYIFYVIYALLAVRFLLALLAARQRAGFVQFIYAVTDPFYAPFRGIVSEPTAESGARFALSILLAIVVYALLHLGINGLLRLIAHRKTEI
jgi:uncharacterized protein YggT (Ycf19 family)